MNRLFSFKLYLSNWGWRLAFQHYLYGGKIARFFSDKTIENMRLDLTLKKIKIISEVFEKDIAFLKRNYKYFPSETKQVIWSYWDSEERPELIKLCTSSVNRYSKIEVVELNESNIKEYLTLPKNIENKYKNKLISKTHFSDILRVNLLYQYGGAWLDSTILMLSDYDFFSTDFWTIKTNRNSNHPLKGKWAGYAMSCNSENKLMYYLVNLFNLYWERYDVLIDYFLIDIFICIIYQFDEDVRHMIDSVPINNVNNEDLDSLMNNVDDECNFENTVIFKLNRKSEKFKYIGEKKTFYKKLLELYGIE